MEVPDHLARPLLSGQGKPIDVGPSDQHGARAERKRLEHVGATADAAVEQHRHPVADRIDDGRQRVDRGDRPVDLPSPVVLSAWGRQLGVDSAADPAVAAFVRAFSQGPQTPEPGAPRTSIAATATHTRRDGAPRTSMAAIATHGSCPGSPDADGIEPDSRTFVNGMPALTAVIRLVTIRLMGTRRSFMLSRFMKVTGAHNGVEYRPALPDDPKKRRPDLTRNRQVLAGYADGHLRIWDIHPPAEEAKATARVLEGHSDGVMAAVISPDGSRVFSGGRDVLVRRVARGIGVKETHCVSKP